MQRANATDGPLLSPIDLTENAPRVRFLWRSGLEVTLTPDPEAEPGRLLSHVREAVPSAVVAPLFREEIPLWWAPEADDPPRLRYAWLLDQLSIDSDYFAMRGLRLLAITADMGSETAEVVLQRLTSGFVVVARFALVAGEMLVHPHDYIADRVLRTEGLAPIESRYGHSAFFVELPS